MRIPGDEIIHQLKQYGIDVYAHDPYVPGLR
jgi:hypothetical protein